MVRRIPFLCAVLMAITGFASCENPIKISGIIGEETVLECDLPTSNPPNIAWKDIVWNQDRNPVLIYNNRDGANPEHTQAENYDVNPATFALTLKKTMKDDAGTIYCESVINATTTLKKEYDLSTTEPPMCEGNYELTNGQNTKLSCKAQFSGDIPTLQWMRGSEALQQDDEFDIQLAKVSVTLDATPDHDQEDIVCKMMHLGKMASCKVTLDVKYLVQDIKIEPATNDVRVKQKITCSARGNPTPKVELNPGMKTGEGSASLMVGSDWLGTVQEVSCTASNTLSGKTEILSKNSTYEVLALPTSAPTEKPNTPKPKPDKNTGEPEEPGPSTGTAGLPIGLIVGIVIGVVVIVVIIIAVICVKRKQAAKKQGHKPIPQHDDLRNDSKA